MKNKLIDLNDHLFVQLERLGEEGLDAQELEQEIARSKAMTGVAEKIIDNASLALQAEKVRSEYLGASSPLPAMLENKK